MSGEPPYQLDMAPGRTVPGRRAPTPAARRVPLATPVGAATSRELASGARRSLRPQRDAAWAYRMDESGHPALVMVRDVAAQEEVARIDRHGPGDRLGLTREGHDPDPLQAGRHGDTWCGARRRIRRGLLGRGPGVLDRLRPDDQLVGVEAAVDDVEADRLAGNQVHDRWHEHVILQDHVHLARRRGDAAPGERDPE